MSELVFFVLININALAILLKVCLLGNVVKNQLQIHNIVLQNIIHVQIGYREYSTEY